MNNRKSAIIIGAGAGGIATSVFLAQKGYEVNVYEKNSFPGGRCGQIINEGHRFDIGATILLMPNLYRYVFQSLGINFDVCLESIPVHTLYRLFFEDGSQLDICPRVEEMKSSLEKIEPGSYNQLQSYISVGYQLYNLAFQKLLGRNFNSPTDFINFKNINLLFRLKAFTKHNTYIKKFFRHPHLKMAFTFQNIYIGQSPFDAPALFSMLPAIEMNEGSMFLKGGMYGVVDKLLKTANDLGVKFHLDSPVKKINIHERKATGITLEDGTSIPADLTIANADLPYVYKNLLPDRNMASRIDRMSYSCSAFVFHWGLNKSFPQLGLHNVFLSDDYHKNLNKIFNEKSLGDRPDFYIYAPSRCDDSAAPPGQDTLSVIVPVGHIDRDTKQDWDILEKKARTAVFSKLKEALGENVEDHVKFEIPMVPSAWENQLNVTRGGVFGSLSHNIMQMGYFRPHNRHDKYKNLYFVGGSTHPGSGIPLVLLSAKLVSDRILNEN
jgi:phytoene desaturase